MVSGIEQERQNNNIYLKIVDGSLRQKSQEGVPGALPREWKAGGKEGTTWELSSPAAFGKITNIEFYDGEYEGKKFTNLQITLDENEDGKHPVISVGATTKYAQEIMKKLPNINLQEEVRIRPYKFLPEGEEKDVTGVEITQRDTSGQFNKKVDSYFIKKVGETWEPVNGYPKRAAPWSFQSEEERDIYKIQCRSFLKKSTEKIALQFRSQPDEGTTAHEMSDQTNETDDVANSIPF